MNPHDAVAYLALLLIVSTVIGLRWGPCDHEECHRVHRVCVKQDEERESDRKHDEWHKDFKQPGCRRCR